MSHNNDDKELVKLSRNVLKTYRELMETGEKNAFLEVAEKKAAQLAAGGRKGELGFESSRSMAKTKLEIKQDAIKEEKKAMEEFTEQQEIVLKSPTPPPSDDDDEPNPLDSEEYKKRVMEDLEESFRLFDINGDGKISLQELMSVMSSVGKDVTVDDAQDILEDIDLDGDGEINFEEFKSVMYETMMTVTVDDDLKEAFDVFDTDGDGYISPFEIKLIFEKLGELLSPEEAMEIMMDCDVNKDGLIDFEEFKSYYAKMNDQYVKTAPIEPAPIDGNAPNLNKFVTAFSGNPENGTASDKSPFPFG